MNRDSRLIFEQYEDVINNTGPVKSKKTTQLKVITKLDKNDLDKSEVLVDGLGVHNIGAIKTNVAEKLQDLANRIKNNEPHFAYKKIYEKYSVLKGYLEALVLAEKDIEHMRRAGQLPGVQKRFF